MVRLIMASVFAFVCSSSAALAASDADAPSFPCTGYNNQFVRMVIPVTLAPVNTEVPSNGSIVNFKFSSGMSGKDITVPVLDGQTSGVTMAFEGFCGQNYLNIHWAYNSGVEGSAYSVEFGDIIKVIKIQ